MSYQSFFGVDEGIGGTIESNTDSCITYSLSSYEGYSMLGGYESQLQPLFADMAYHEAGYITQDANSGVTGQSTGVPRYAKHKPLYLAKIQINKALGSRYIFNSNLEQPSVIHGYLCSNDASISNKEYRALNADTHEDLGEVSFELDEEEYSTYWRYSVNDTQTNVLYGTDVNNVNNVNTRILITGVEF